jgi:ATP synthase protein I
VPEPSKRSPLVEAARYMQLGVMMVAPMLLLGGLGYWLDGRFGTGPWLLLAGLLAGMGVGFANFFTVVLGSGGGPGR